MNTIIINGMKIEYDGNGSISVIGNCLRIGTKEINIGEKVINIEGNCGTITCKGNVNVTGNVNGNVDCAGSCTCGDVGGDIDAGGSVRANNAKANIDAGGSVHINGGLK